MAYERVAKAILNAPWRNEEGGVEEEDRNKKRKGKGKPKGSPRAEKGAMVGTRLETHQGLQRRRDRGPRWARVRS